MNPNKECVEKQNLAQLELKALINAITGIHFPINKAIKQVSEALGEDDALTPIKTIVNGISLFNRQIM